VQATVLRFDPATGSGAVVLDDGVELGFGAEAFRASRLRLLRPGQRVRVTRDDERPGELASLQILTIAGPG
jgi:cold shock CspA family protein